MRAGLLVAALIASGLGRCAASPGDLIASSDFRNVPWKIYAEKGTGGGNGLELDSAQNIIKLKDQGDFDWFFESPPAFMSGDMTRIYNGTISYQLQSLEWQSTFKGSGFDLVLVSTNKFYSIGISGVKADGDTSVLYNVTVNESVGWRFLNPKIRQGLNVKTVAARDDIIMCLKTLKAIRVRGGYFTGHEKTQLREVYAKQGIIAGDAAVDPLSDDGCCSSHQRDCQSEQRMELIFNNPGVPCYKLIDLQSGVVNLGPATANLGAASQTWRLDPTVSSPVHDFYVGKTLTVKGDPGTEAGYGKIGSVTNYLGALDWRVSTGVTALEIVRAGSGCSSGGFYEGVGGNGHGFRGQFEVLFTIPSVTIHDGGKGCALGDPAANTRSTWTVAVDASGGVTGVATNDVKNAAGAWYEVGAAVPGIVVCEPPCYGHGLEVTCNVDANRHPTAVAVVSAGMGYTAGNGGLGATSPTILCAEGRVTATDVTGGAGTGFDGVFASTVGYVGTVASGISHIRVVNAGTGYTGPVTLDLSGQNDMCHAYNLTADLSGYITDVTVLEAGVNYTSPPIMVISGNGSGCVGQEVRATINDMTADKFYAAGALEATTNRQMLYLGLSASDVDDYYTGMTIVLTKGAPSNLAAAELATIVEYRASGRVAYLAASSVTTLPQALDGYAITPTLKRALEDAPRGVDFVTPASGDLEADISSSGSGTSQVFTITLDSANAPAIADYYTGQVISFTTQSAAGLSAYIISYAADRTAVIAVEGSAHTGYSNQIPASLATNVVLHGNVGYVVSLSFLATIAFTDPANTWPTTGTTVYELSYRDDSAAQLAHQYARPFYCDQRVGDNPTTDWIALPFRESFAFKAVPLICGQATLTVAAVGMIQDDVTWKGNKLTVLGESGEVLGNLFEEDESLMSTQVGGPVFDTIAISAEKMIEFTGDGDFEFTLYSQTGMTGNLKFRYMKLGFSPTACFTGVVATDQFTIEDEALEQGGKNQYNLSVVTPPGEAGLPASDGVVTVTADGSFAEAYLRLGYTGDGGEALLFDDWAWGAGNVNYTLVEPADVSAQCRGEGAYPDFFCQPSLMVPRNGTRRNTVHHRIPRRVFKGVVSPGRADFNFEIVDTNVAKISPVTLNYALLKCWMKTLRANRDGQIFGAQLFRPSFPTFTFEGTPPKAGGDGILWLHAVWQHHSVHVRDSRGLTSGGIRLFRNDANEPYDLVLEKDRDPNPAYEYSSHRHPHKGALGVHVGEQGEFIAWAFKDDYAQYDPDAGFVTSIRIPKRVLDQFQLKEDKRVAFSLDVPPGEGSIVIKSAVVSFPLAE